MAAVGIPVDLSVAALDVEIEHGGGVHDTMVFDLRDGRAGYVIDTNQMSRPVRCRNLELGPLGWIRNLSGCQTPGDGERATQLPVL